MLCEFHVAVVGIWHSNVRLAPLDIAIVVHWRVLTLLACWLLMFLLGAKSSMDADSMSKPIC